MENEMTIKGAWLFELQIHRWTLQLEVQKAEQALHETEEWKLLEAKKAELAQYTALEENAKSSILDGMLANNLKVLEFDNQRFTVKTNPPSVKIINEDLIPAEYKVEKVTVSVDKKKIKDAIKNGGIVEWAELDCTHSLLVTPK